MRTDRGANKRKEQKSDLVAGTTPKHEAWQDKLVWYKGRQGLFRKEGRGTLVRTIGRRKDKEIRVTLISYLSQDKTNAIQTMCVTQWQCLTMVRTWGTMTSFSLSGTRGSGTYLHSEKVRGLWQMKGKFIPPKWPSGSIPGGLVLRDRTLLARGQTERSAKEMTKLLSEHGDKLWIVVYVDDGLKILLGKALRSDP